MALFALAAVAFTIVYAMAVAAEPSTGGSTAAPICTSSPSSS